MKRCLLLAALGLAGIFSAGSGLGPRPALAIPANDNFANAIAFTTPAVSGVVATGDNTGAGTEAGEPTQPTCATGITTTGATVWYNWTSPGSPGTVALDTYGSNFDTVLAVYTGSAVNSLTLAGCNDDFGGNNAHQSALALNYAASTTYHIQVGGFTGFTGSIVLNLSLGADIFVNNPVEGNASDTIITLREAMLFARGGTGPGGLNRPLSVNEGLLVLNAAAASSSSSDLVHFNPTLFPSGSIPSTISLTSALPDLNGTGDVVSGAGAGVIVDGQISAFSCFPISGGSNVLEGLQVRRCGTGISITGNGNQLNPHQSWPLTVRESITGIYLNGNNTTLLNSMIGTDASGTSALGNTGPGVWLDHGSNSVLRNLVSSGNTGAGVLLTGGAQNNTINSSFIGTDITGTVKLPNGDDGIRINNAFSNCIGGVYDGSPCSPVNGSGNVIAGNALNGIEIMNVASTNNYFWGNTIGTNASGSATIGNTFSGILINGAGQAFIGGSASFTRNSISGNGNVGIFIENQFASGNVIAGNYIGLKPDGSATLPNTGDGVFINDASGNTVGGATAGAGNVISGNTSNGVEIGNPGGSTNSVLGNLIGTDPTGTLDFGNNGIGVLLNGAPNNTIGGTSAGARNVISGNNQQGVFAGPTGATGNQVQGNYIGVNAAGTAALANTLDGVQVNGAANNTIGGTAVGAGNLISGNGSYGLHIANSGATGTQVQGNYIGLNAAGTAAIPNSSDGVAIDAAPNNTIGGTASGAGNVISGNTGSGVDIFNNGSSGNAVLGNLIGLNAAGTAGIANGGQGVLINSVPNNAVGGTAAGSRNFLSANTLDGVQITGAGAMGNSVLGNFIGFSTGGSALPNLRNGVTVDAGSATSTIGSLTSPNLIYYNGNGGIVVAGATTSGATLRGNFIFANGGLGIDLNSDGVTANDAGDADTGPNGLQNYPVVQSVSVGATTTTVNASLNSTPNTSFTVDFYFSQSCDASGNGEGQSRLGQATFTTDGSGNSGLIASTFSFVVPAYRFITATATDLSGNTSEYSACVPSVDSADDDGDGYTDVAEAGAPLCSGAVNDDSADDALINDGCPAVGAPETNCNDAVDDDGDGFVNDGCPQAGSFSEAQFHIGTSPQAPCGGSGWPSNLFDSGLSTNKLDIQDVTSFVAPVRRMGTNPGDPNFSSRYDLVPGKGILATFINLNDITALVAGTSGFPPMFNGARIFGHACPFPP